MRKAYLILILLCLSVSCFAQMKNYSFVGIDYKGIQNFYIDSINYKIPQLIGVETQFIPYSQELRVFKQLDISSEIDIDSPQNLKFEYVPVAIEELGQIILANIPTKQKLTLNNVKSRDHLQLAISFYPYIKEDSGLKRVKSVSFNHKIKSPNLRRSSSSIPLVSNSVLHTGNFYKFYIEKSGVYKLSKAELNKIFGSVTINPRKIKIYGHGGDMLPFSNGIEVPFDLVENAIEVVGEQDGILNDQDYVLFYAKGVTDWNSENNTSVNLYDTKAYYYISIDGADGKRISLASLPTQNPSVTYTTYNQIDVYEKDLINVGRLGRKWVGENFNIQNSKDFTFTLPNLKLDVPIDLEVNAVASSSVQTKFDVKLNNILVGNINFSRITADNHVGGYENVLRVSEVVNSSTINVNLNYNNFGVPTSNGYVDYIKIFSTNNLKGYNKQFKFYNANSFGLLGVGNYQIENATFINKIWDITDLYNITAIPTSGSSTVSFNFQLGSLKYYVAIDERDLYTIPSQSISKIQNQNLKKDVFTNVNGQFADVDYLIITQNAFLSEANRLAEFHRINSNYNVKVVDIQTIYNEFSSGQKDIVAIRNFIRYVYFNASTPNKRVQFVNLFGDTSFDYKNVIPNNNNIVPTFQYLGLVTPSNLGSAVNFSNYSTFMSDDFFVLMDDNEGNISFNYQQGLDIAIGRMLFSDLTKAKQMVDKVTNYNTPSTFGRWRNNIVLLSDDIDATSDLNLQSDLNAIALNIEADRPYINIKKIYMDAYLQTVSAGGNRYIQAKADFINAFDSGSLLINYYGHGGERVLASERIFEIQDVEKLKNENKLPLFITITCEVSRFDNPYLQSLGEYVYLKNNGGAVALLTTTREIGITSGSNINRELTRLLFNYQNESISIGEALRRTKNQFSTLDRYVVFCIGDPALKLAFAQPKVVLNKINGQDIDGTEDVLKALNYVTLEGEILDENNTFLADFNGDLAVQIFDKNMQRTTLGNDRVVNPSTNQVQIMNFETLGETIFRGNATVVEGKFQFGFVVPKDIRIPVGNGKISFYAKNTALKLDKTGYNAQIKIGGINENAPTDNNPPLVKLYMNDTSFISGGTTNPSPIFLAYLEDDNGINTASGIGHDIIAILDGDEMNPYVLNDFYETELNNYKKGKVRFPFNNLSPGLHTITFKAWDVYNNPVIAEIQFYVLDGDGVTLSNVLNYPNPFVNYTEFWFTHNRPFEPLKVQVQIMTISGKVVKTINDIIQTEGFLSRSIKWDGKDDFGDKLAKGVYIYKLTVQSTLTNKKSEKVEKLVIL